jgi:hypothetical protein
MDADVRGLITDANNLCGSEGVAINPNSDFNSDIAAVNQNETALNGADQPTASLQALLSER